MHNVNTALAGVVKPAHLHHSHSLARLSLKLDVLKHLIVVTLLAVSPLVRGPFIINHHFVGIKPSFLMKNHHFKYKNVQSHALREW